MTEDNLENKPLESNLEMVNYIMLHRIYDLLSLIAKEIAGGESTEKMLKYHEQGYLLGPAPSYSVEERQDNGE